MQNSRPADHFDNETLIVGTHFTIATILSVVLSACMVGYSNISLTLTKSQPTMHAKPGLIGKLTPCKNSLSVLVNSYIMVQGRSL